MQTLVVFFRISNIFIRHFTVPLPCTKSKSALCCGLALCALSCVVWVLWSFPISNIRYPSLLLQNPAWFVYNVLHYVQCTIHCTMWTVTPVRRSLPCKLCNSLYNVYSTSFTSYIYQLRFQPICCRGIGEHCGILVCVANIIKLIIMVLCPMWNRRVPALGRMSAELHSRYLVVWTESWDRMAVIDLLYLTTRHITIIHSFHLVFSFGWHSANLAILALSFMARQTCSC